MDPGDSPQPKERPPVRRLAEGAPRHVMRLLSSAEPRAIDMVTSLVLASASRLALQVIVES
jgi:hypothetical protein